MDKTKLLCIHWSVPANKKPTVIDAIIEIEDKPNISSPTIGDVEIHGKSNISSPTAVLFPFEITYKNTISVYLTHKTYVSTTK